MLIFARLDIRQKFYKSLANKHILVATKQHTYLAWRLTVITKVVPLG
jgi:hypothetical protein